MNFTVVCSDTDLPFKTDMARVLNNTDILTKTNRGEQTQLLPVSGKINGKNYNKKCGNKRCLKSFGAKLVVWLLLVVFSGGIRNP